MQAIALPILVNNRGGQLIKVVADNLFVQFDDPVQGINAVADVTYAVAQYSQGRRKNDQIRLSIGVDYGDVYVLQSDTVGAAVDLAFELRENLVDAGEIAISETLFILVQEQGWHVDITTHQPDDNYKPPMRYGVVTRPESAYVPPVVPYNMDTSSESEGLRGMTDILSSELSNNMSNLARATGDVADALGTEVQHAIDPLIGRTVGFINNIADVMEGMIDASGVDKRSHTSDTGAGAGSGAGRYELPAMVGAGAGADDMEVHVALDLDTHTDSLHVPLGPAAHHSDHSHAQGEGDGSPLHDQKSYCSQLSNTSWAFPGFEDFALYCRRVTARQGALFPTPLTRTGKDMPLEFAQILAAVFDCRPDPFTYIYAQHVTTKSRKHAADSSHGNRENALNDSTELSQPHKNPPTPEQLDLRERQEAHHHHVLNNAQALVKEQFQHTCAVAVFEMHGRASDTAEENTEEHVALVTQYKTLTEDLVRGHGGRPVVAISDQFVAQVVGLFDSPVAALTTGLEVRYSTRAALGHEVAIGIGFGPIIDLNGMNVFGDEVNMAFKLGEDVAHGGDLLITMPFVNALKTIARTPHTSEANTDNTPIQATSEPELSIEEALELVRLPMVCETCTVTLSGVEIPYISMQFPEDRAIGSQYRRESTDQDITKRAMPWTDDSGRYTPGPDLDDDL